MFYVPHKHRKPSFADSKLDGAQIVCLTLEALGVRTIFGLPGTQNVSLFEGLRTSSIRTVYPTHELGAGFMACGYARATGKVGVLTSIPGPGFTYALTALVEAREDSIPLLYISVSSELDSEHKYQIQVIDQKSMVRPIAKGIFEINHVQEISTLLAQACTLACSGEPGPVYVSIGASALKASLTQVYAPASSETNMTAEGRAADLELLAERIVNSHRPVIFSGAGCLGCGTNLQQLAELLSSPVLGTLSGRGVLAEDHNLSFYYDLASGVGPELNKFLEESDLILALGCKFTHNGSAGFQLKLAPDKLVHVDASEEVLGANYLAHLKVCADLPKFLEKLLVSLRGRVERTKTNWAGHDLSTLREELIEEQRTRTLNPSLIEGKASQEFFKLLRKFAPRESTLVLDSGTHQVMARSYYPIYCARGVIAPSDFQSMSFAIPAAIGAVLGEPSRPVLCMVGDGGFLMSGFELLTAVRENCNLTVFVFNDGNYGLIRQHQLASWGSEHCVSLRNPEFQKLSEALGVAYFRFAEMNPADLSSCLELPGVKLVELRLSDSPELEAIKSKAITRRKLKNFFGPNLVSALKKITRN